MHKRTMALLIFACLLVGLSGCGAIRYGMYVLFGGNQKKTYPAEFDKLPGKSLAIVVYTPPAVQSDYPAAQGEISQLLVNAFRARAASGDIKDLRVVEANDVHGYIEGQLNWEGYERTRIGRDLKVDYLLLVSVMDFSTRDGADMIGIYRGRMAAQAALYDTSLPEEEAIVWPRRGSEDKAMFSVAYPSSSLAGQVVADNDLQVRWRTMGEFADKLAKKFYKHTVEITDEDPNRQPS